MNNKHTPEPWGELKHVQEAGMGDCFVVRDEKKECIFIAEKANARRIVACVNACAGIETERLEENAADPIAGLFGRMAARAEKENRTLTAQRDELLAALKEVSLISTTNQESYFMYQIAIKAIKKYDHA